MTHSDFGPVFAVWRLSEHANTANTPVTYGAAKQTPNTAAILLIFIQSFYLNGKAASDHWTLLYI